MAVNGVKHEPKAPGAACWEPCATPWPPKTSARPPSSATRRAATGRVRGRKMPGIWGKRWKNAGKTLETCWKTWENIWFMWLNGEKIRKIWGIHEKNIVNTCLQEMYPGTNGEEWRCNFDKGIHTINSSISGCSRGITMNGYARWFVQASGKHVTQL